MQGYRAWGHSMANTHTLGPMLTTTVSCARHIPHTTPQPSPHACHQAPPASTGEDRPGFLWYEGLMRPERQSFCVTPQRSLGKGG